MKKVVDLQQFGDFLGTRLLGKEAREVVVSALGSEAEVIVDFSGITGISVSFADEFGGKLLDAIGVETFRARVRFRNADKGIADIVRFAMNGRLRAQ